MMKFFIVTLSCLFSVLAQGFYDVEQVYKSKESDVIWGFDFVDADTLVLTERSGRMFRVNLKRKGQFEISGVPPVWNRGQGGLLDLRVHPQQKDKLFWTFSLPTEKGATTALASGQLVGNALKNVRVIFQAKAADSNKIHFGSRIEFDQKGHLFISIGDRNERSEVQNLNYHTGKIVRIKEDGSVPSDNPFVTKKDALPEIWALGVRSPQGLVFDPVSQELIESEMGPRGGDEINIIRKGANYGWPEITYGREYWGPKIGAGTEKSGMEQPLVYWVPSISPSGITFYTGAAFPQWRNDLFIGTLSGQHLRRLKFKDGKVVEQEELLKSQKERIRNVRTGPDGALYFSTDSGLIKRLVPQK